MGWTVDPGRIPLPADLRAGRQTPTLARREAWARGAARLAVRTLAAPARRGSAADYVVRVLGALLMTIGGGIFAYQFEPGAPNYTGVGLVAAVFATIALLIQQIGPSLVLVAKAWIEDRRKGWARKIREGKEDQARLVKVHQLEVADLKADLGADLARKDRRIEDLASAVEQLKAEAREREKYLLGKIERRDQLVASLIDATNTVNRPWMIEASVRHGIPLPPGFMARDFDKAAGAVADIVALNEASPHDTDENIQEFVADRADPETLNPVLGDPTGEHSTLSGPEPD